MKTGHKLAKGTGSSVNQHQFQLSPKYCGAIKKRNAGLTYSILAAISFKTVSLGMYTEIPLD
jgi:hypothetical protein